MICNIKEYNINVTGNTLNSHISHLLLFIVPIQKKWDFKVCQELAKFMIHWSDTDETA